MSKRKALAIFGIVCSVVVLWHGVTDFDKATNGIQIFKAIFWLFTGVTALTACIQNYKNDEWPL